MRNISFIGSLTIVALLAATGVPANATQLATITFLGAPSGVTDGVDYVTPYELSIDKGLGTGPVLQLVTCYDTFDNVDLNDQWNANLFTLAQAAASGYFSGAANALAGYEQIGWLSAQSYSNTDQQVALQHAIWDVFGTAPADQNSAQDIALAGYVNAVGSAASHGYNGFDFSSTVFIEEAGVAPGQVSTEQAFVYFSLSSSQTNNFGAPEPGPAVLLGSGLILLLGSFRISRIFRR